MKCPQCGSPRLQVQATIRPETGSTPMKALRNVGHVRRRRECMRCHRLFYTIEVIEADFFDALRAIGETEIAGR